MKVKIGALISIVIVISVIAVAFLLNNYTNFDFVKTGKCVRPYEKTCIQEDLSADEITQICTMFKGKLLYRDNPSCGFSENIAIVFNDNQTFCIARDGCPIIYWKEKNRYFRITEAQKEQLYSILDTHGLRFPCV